MSKPKIWGADMSQRKLLSVSLLAFTAIITASSVSLAQSTGEANTNSNASTAPQQINLDLGSAERNLTAGHLIGTGSVNILVNGGSVSVTGQTILTPAERLAVYQVVSTGNQSIMLGANGTAIGGSLTVGSRFSDFVSSLSVPQGVSVLFDAAKNPTMNLLGNLTNAGAIYAYSTNANVSTASLSALNIINQSGSVLSSILPAGLSANISNVSASTNLNLSAVQNIINAGTMSSSGNLSLSAGNAIVNMLTPGSSALPVMQALGALNIQASNIVNQGAMTALTNNLNLSTATLTNSGTIQALLGSASIQSQLGNSLLISNNLGEITARDVLNFSTQQVGSNELAVRPVLSIEGGTLSATAMAMLSPYGDINLDLYRINGDLNIKSKNANIKVEGGSLNITSLDLSGDPSFTNVTGDVNLGPGPTTPGLASFNIFSGGPVFTTGGALFNVSAGGDIVALNGAAGTVDASLFGGVGGAITLTAGTGPDGGSVILPTVNFKTNGNSIQITATASAKNAGTVSVGTLNTSGAGGVCCNAGTGQSGQAAGSITINAPGGISTGSIQAFGGGGAGGYCCDSSGGEGGNGGLVQLTSDGNIVVGGEINTSGGGGGGLSASQTASTSGGKGGNAGSILVNTPGTFLSFGPLLAAGGGGGAGNTAPPCCPQAYRNGGGSFGGGGGGGDVGAGGGGFYGGGGSLSIGSGGGGGFFGGGGGDNGQPSGSLGMGGSSTEGSTLFFTGGVFGAGGGGQGSFGGDGNLINNTFVNQKGFGNAGGAPGANGNITMNVKSVQVTSNVGQFFPGAGFTSSPFSNVTVFGNYSGPQVNVPSGSVTPINSASSVPLPKEQVIPTVGLTSAQIAALFGGLTSLDGSQSGSVRNFDTSGIQNVTDWGLNLSSTGSIILVNDPNSNKSLASILAVQANGVSSAGNSLSSAMNSLDTDIGQIYVALSRRTGDNYKAPGHEATGLSQNGPLVGTLTDPITISMINALFTFLQVRNDLAAKQADLEGRYSWTGMGSYLDGGFGSLPTYDGGDGFVSLASYNESYSDWQNRPSTSTFSTGTNAELALKILGGETSILELTGGQGDGPSGGSGGGGSDSVKYGKTTQGTGNGVPIKFTPYTKTTPDGKTETGVIATWSKDGSEYTFPGAELGPGKQGQGTNLTLPGGKTFFIPKNGGNIKSETGAPVLTLKDPANMTKGPIDTTSAPRTGGNNNSSNQGPTDETQKVIDEVNKMNMPQPSQIYDLPFAEALSMNTLIAESAVDKAAVQFAESVNETQASKTADVQRASAAPARAEVKFAEKQLLLLPFPVLAEVQNGRRINDAIRGLRLAGQVSLSDLEVSLLMARTPLARRKAFLLATRLKSAEKHKQYLAALEQRNEKSHDMENVAHTPKNFFLCPTKKIKINVNEFKISIAAGAKVLLLNSGYSVGIYNLHDNHRDDVSVSSEGNLISVAPGRFLVLSPQTGDRFERINPGQPLAYRAITEISTRNASIYTGEFSPVSALASVSCLKDLSHSSNAADRKTYRALVKTTVALMHIQRNGEPFKNAAVTPTANSGHNMKVLAKKISMIENQSLSPMLMHYGCSTRRYSLRKRSISESETLIFPANSVE